MIEISRILICHTGGSLNLNPPYITPEGYQALETELCNDQQKPDILSGSISKKIPLELDRRLIAQRRV